MVPQTQHKQRLRNGWWHSYLIALSGAPLLIGVFIAESAPVYPLRATALALLPVMISAYLGGFVAACVAIVVGVITIAVTGGQSIAELDRADALMVSIERWTIFTLIGLLLAVFIEAAHRARRRAEASELRAASTLANIDEAVVVTDGQDRIAYANPAACALVAEKIDDVFGKGFTEVFCIVDRKPPSQDAAPQPVQLRAVTEMRVDRYALLQKDGRRIPLEVTVAPIRENGNHSGSTVVTMRDCSERERTETALRERLSLQEQLTAIATMLPGALHAVRMYPDGSTRLTYASPNFAEVFGSDPTPFYDDAHRMAAFVHPEDRVWLGVATRKAADELKTVRLEHRVLHPKKGVVWLELYAAPVLEHGGTVLITGIFFDITQRKLSQDSLKQNEARLLGIVDSSMDAIITWDDRQGIVMFNPAAEHMFRCTEAGMLSLTLETFITSYLQTDSSLLINMLQRDEIRDLRLGELSNLYGRRSDGEVFPLELSVSRTQIDGRRLLTMTLRDITERKRAAERLQASQQQLRAALEAGSMGVVKLYTKSREVEFDEKSLEQTGVKCQPHFRQPLNVLLDVVHPDERRRLMREYLCAVRDRTAFRTEYRIVDGADVRWLVMRGGMWVEEGGQEAQLTAIVTDVTYRKLLEEQRLRSQKLESLGVLAGGIAHDFNNLLLAITGNLKLAMADLGDAHPALASLREINKAATRATDLVRRILAFSRPQDHKREPVSLVAVVDEVLGLARAVLPASITIRMFSLETSPMVFADATQVHQALINLLTNAADAVPESGGEIEIHLDVVDVDARLHDEDQQLQVGKRYARITVSDNGEGMGATTLSRIFDPFYTTKPLGQGTGLGLAIVHGIMKSHEGAVTVQSEVGRGTSFALYFPVYMAPALPAPAPVIASGPAKQGHVLYVDDEEALVFLMKRVLERMGHRVTGYTVPEKALEAFVQQPEAFDLVVSDMSMPGMSGLELARRILTANSRVPVIITTGFVRAEDYQAAAEVGVRQLILKPNTIEELGLTIERVLQGKEVATS